MRALDIFEGTTQQELRKTRIDKPVHELVAEIEQLEERLQSMKRSYDNADRERTKIIQECNELHERISELEGSSFGHGYDDFLEAFMKECLYLVHRVDQAEAQIVVAFIMDAFYRITGKGLPRAWTQFCWEHDWKNTIREFMIEGAYEWKGGNREFIG